MWGTIISWGRQCLVNSLPSICGMGQLKARLAFLLLVNTNQYFVYFCCFSCSGLISALSFPNGSV